MTRADSVKDGRLSASDDAATALSSLRDQAPSGLDPDGLQSTGAVQTCGSCSLWGANFYPHHPGWPVNKTCCADVVMDLPASFIPKRQTMEAHEGEGCICWRPLEDRP